MDGFPFHHYVEPAAAESTAPLIFVQLF